MGKRPTIQMVADRAGVSRGTVDRVLNNRSYVKAEVRTRILAAMQELGYVSPRDAHQRVLSESRFSPIRLGVILPNWPDDHFRNEVQRGIQTARAGHRTARPTSRRRCTGHRHVHHRQHRH